MSAIPLPATIRSVLRAIMPPPVRRWARRVSFGSLRRLEPVSRRFGMDRGRPIDRHYIERFLERHVHDVRGRVLEIGDDAYTRRFGGTRVGRSEVLHLHPHPSATIVADLADAPQIPDNSFDCVIFTQTLMFIYDVRAAMRTLHRVLRPGGALLATFAGISQIARYDADRWGDYWRLTSMSAARLLGEIFGPDAVEVSARGNVLAAIGMLHGLACEDLRPEELDHHDPDYEVIITARAVKGES